MKQRCVFYHPVNLLRKKKVQDHVPFNVSDWFCRSSRTHKDDVCHGETLPGTQRPEHPILKLANVKRFIGFCASGVYFFIFIFFLPWVRCFLTCVCLSCRTKILRLSGWRKRDTGMRFPNLQGTCGWPQYLKTVKAPVTGTDKGFPKEDAASLIFECRSRVRTK